MKAFGFVRGSDLVLCVLSAKKLTGPLVCELSLLNSGTGAVFSETRGVESCSGVDDVAAKTVQRLRAGDGSEKMEEMWIKVEAALSERAQLVSAVVKVLGVVGEGWSVVPFESKKASLLNMFPDDDTAASEALWFQSSQSRQIDTETLLVVARSAMTNAKLSPGIRVNATVVYLYKCIELRKQVNFEKFSGIYKNVRRLTHSLSRDRSSKRDGVLLRLSLDTAAWHYCVLAGWDDELKWILENIASFNSSDEESPLYALNYSSALVMSLLFSVRGGDMERMNVLAAKIIDEFYHAVSLRASVSQWFVDYGVVHENALNAMKIRESLAGKGSVSDELVIRSLRSCLRVKGNEFVKIAGKRLADSCLT